MPITKQTTIANGLVASFHLPTTLKADMKLKLASVHLVSYCDEAGYLAGKPIVWNWDIDIPYSSVGQDIETLLTTTSGGDFFGGTVSSDTIDSIDTIKQRKNSEINAARLNADRTSFVFLGKPIATDELSALDIASVNGIVTLTGAMPQNWAGAWKAKDNSYVAIADRDAWVAFYSAMVQAGTDNFNHAQSLKATLASAGNADAIAAIVW